MGMTIDRYNGAKREQRECQSWAAMLGKTYYGGTRGQGERGELRSLHLAMRGDDAPTIYYQESDGAKNYHTMPAALAPHLEAAIKARFAELLKDALERQKAAVKAVAAEAVKEHARLIKEAGLAA